MWFDRDISFEVGGDLSADIVSLPRLITSRSHEKLGSDRRLTRKKSIKLVVVERAIHNVPDQRLWFQRLCGQVFMLV